MGRHAMQSHKYWTLLQGVRGTGRLNQHSSPKPLVGALVKWTFTDHSFNSEPVYNLWKLNDPLLYRCISSNTAGADESHLKPKSLMLGAGNEHFLAKLSLSSFLKAPLLHHQSRSPDTDSLSPTGLNRMSRFKRLCIVLSLLRLITVLEGPAFHRIHTLVFYIPDVRIQLSQLAFG